MPSPSRLTFGSCFVLLAPALAACGGGGGGNANGNGQLTGSESAQFQQFCSNFCNKILQCEDAGALGTDCSAFATECAVSASGSSAGTFPPGCNVSAFLNDINSCLSQPCSSSSSTSLAPYETCFIQVEANNPACSSSTSTGTPTNTSTSSSNSTSTSSSSSAASCSICDKAGACCQAIDPDAGGLCAAYSTSECNNIIASDPTFASSCQDILTEGQGQGLAQCM